ncbi:hypothetical protein [Streptomyces sp. MB09-02B]|uniref:hypothetical protein n=1 Tax=Streptomyces sp. MB09-02B TaxID=3028667 RepID=UPI0029A7E18C|nr:hypothetical protein [Streptomyces sp. MB09-02B]MDX3643226.1 hypothetical protein [Streptomyces sp. MB09-02B]
MSLDLLTYRNTAISYAMASGLFGNVLDHEPVSAPGSGLTAAFWVSRIGPVPIGSGLSATTGRLQLMGRLLMPADTEPQGDVDTAVTGAVDALLTAYSGDFEFGGSVRCIDLLGAYGASLQAEFGYTSFSGGTTYRVATITIPLIINDAWTQVA